MIYSYTDLHDADEDKATNARQGGRWDTTARRVLLFEICSIVPLLQVKLLLP